ncbi:hypothetical protein THAOC_29126 [Thalassiosira oceanica]|uniref:Uncharacterized protein n=1 Tax=Thalassiosira oceanica TaxID=159749 RepID=K0RER2_THAOC|nr:hypothetical protein THAOC_29126 [Thalassiosira oceanica]|eukprot:EJK51680.1 hypothetical protein THAOC_29126 [Thalassiosira oceanica]
MASIMHGSSMTILTPGNQGGCTTSTTIRRKKTCRRRRVPVLQSADDDGAELNDHQKWHIGQKAIYLREAYKLALEKWGNQVNWMSICTEAALLSSLRSITPSMLVMGDSVVITTKYHAEYAGEGIEYSWGLAKCFYRRQPLSKKKKKANFFALVDQCLSQELLTKDMVRKFSKRARDYMLAYRAFETDEMKGGMKDSGKPLDITHHMIEKMKKVVSSHRAALDHDRGYLDKIIKEECFDLVRFVVKSESKSLPVKREESSACPPALRPCRLRVRASRVAFPLRRQMCSSKSYGTPERDRMMTATLYGIESTLKASLENVTE